MILEMWDNDNQNSNGWAHEHQAHHEEIVVPLEKLFIDLPVLIVVSGKSIVGD